MGIAGPHSIADRCVRTTATAQQPLAPGNPYVKLSNMHYVLHFTHHFVLESGAEAAQEFEQRQGQQTEQRRVAQATHYVSR